METIKRDIVETDILIVGGGPAGLATSIHLADLINQHNDAVESGLSSSEKIPSKILLIEKGSEIGKHTISGSIIKPETIKELIPGIDEKDIPMDVQVTNDQMYFLTKNKAFPFPFTPSFMKNEGNYVISLGRITPWLASIAEKKGVQIYPGFAGYSLIYERDRVVGVQTGDTGVDKQGNAAENYQPGTEIRAKLTILAEGSRGHLARDLKEKFNLEQGRNPQVYSLGVKERWEIPEGTFEPGRVCHLMGYPLGFSQFGGGFIYGISKNRIALGLVSGLDYYDPTFDPHNAFQVFKSHPFIKKILKDGKMLRYGAKTIPEGGFFSIPQLFHDGVLLVGDNAGFLSIPSLKGVHLVIHMSMLGAKTAFEALKNNDFSRNKLSLYEKLFQKSPVYKELYRFRNFRQAFQNNLFFGALFFVFQLLTFGRGITFSGKRKVRKDRASYKHLSKVRKTFNERFKDRLTFDKQLTFDKVTDVYYSGTHHDENQPSHCVLPNPVLCQNVCIPEYGAPCQHFCPAEVYELVTDAKTGKKSIRIHFENCVHCKTCDVKDPYKNLHWTPPYGGDGPEYEHM